MEVKDIMLDVGWDWEKITFELLDEVKGLIRAIPISTLGGGSDKLAFFPGHLMGPSMSKVHMGLLWSL